MVRICFGGFVCLNRNFLTSQSFKNMEDEVKKKCVVAGIYTSDGKQIASCICCERSILFACVFAHKDGCCDIFDSFCNTEKRLTSFGMIDYSVMCRDCFCKYFDLRATEYRSQNLCLTSIGFDWENMISGEAVRLRFGARTKSANNVAKEGLE